jgi:tetratricopeptide (TPR) repeat protein
MTKRRRQLKRTGRGFCARVFLFALAFSFLTVRAGHAADAVSRFNEANRLYEQQRFSEAAAAYQRLVEAGTVSVPLYFNMGNAWFKGGNLGRAILSYRKAVQIAPRDPNVEANLQFAREQVANSTPLKLPIWREWVNRFTLDEWTITASICLWLWCGVLAAGQFKPGWRKSLRSFAIGLGAAAVLTMIGCGFAIQQQWWTRHSVVITEEAVVRLGPFEESRSAYTLRDGAELVVLDRREGWLQVADGQNRIGWISDRQVAVVQ